MGVKYQAFNPLLGLLVFPFALLVCALLVCVLLVAPVAAERTVWIHPVDAPVVDPFRPPASRFGAGNRGLEYGTAGGEPVVAVAAGTVTFAGRVGGDRFVVVTHPDGLRSTYGYLEGSTVVRGQRVAQGQRVGTAGPGFHLTARLGEVYIDPALLFAGAEVVIRLIDGQSVDAKGVSRRVEPSTGSRAATGPRTSPGTATLGAVNGARLGAMRLDR